MSPEVPAKGGSRCDHIQLRKDVKSGKNKLDFALESK